MSEPIRDNLLKRDQISAHEKKTRLKNEQKERRRKQELKSQPDTPIQSDLLKASYTGTIGDVTTLLDEGFDINEQDSEGRSALFMASQRGHTDMVKLLLSRGAHVNIRTKFGSSSLMLAAMLGFTEVVKILLENGAHANVQNKYGKSALMDVILYNYSDIVKLLLESGATVNTQAHDGRSALMFACYNEEGPQVARQLIQYGADVNLLDKDGMSALMLACVKGHTQLARQLIQCGADVNLLDKDGKSALMLTSIHNRPLVVELLLENGAVTNKQDSDGVCALMFACEAENTEVVSLLLANGAQPDLQNKSGFTSLMIAILNSDHTELISILLQRGANANIQNNQGQSALMMACTLQLRPAFEFLIEYGAQIDLQDEDGKSALIHAVGNGYTDLAISLIERGAQIDLQDNKGWCPLMYAVKAGDLETVQLLIAYGASVHLKNNDQSTLFDICPRELFYTPLFQEMFQTFLTTVNANLKLDSEYPGIIFFQSPVIKHLNSSATEIDHLGELGISISVPEDSLSSSEEPLELAIRPCFSGPFKLPRKYKSASPAFLIHHSRRVEFQKDITIRILHDFNLRNEEDCEDMAFLSASATPEYKGSRPVYVFKKIRNAKTVFRPGDQVGEIALRHFCLTKVAVKRKREEEETTSKKYKNSQHHLYSARLYRNLQHIGPVSAVFCISMIHPIYTKHCDSVISSEYTGMTGKGEGRSQVCAEMEGDEVTVHSSEKSGFSITFDKKPTIILKRDIHLPELMNIDVHELTDYPPRLSIYVQQISPDFTPPEVQVIGLDRKCSFELEVFPHSPLQPPILIEKGSTKETSRLLPQAGSPLAQFSENQTGTYPMNMDSKISQCQKWPETQSPELTSDLDPMLAALSTGTLGIGDLGDVLEAVEALSARWRVFCTKLRLREHTLDLIEQNYPGDCKTCLCKALGEWLRQNYDYQRHGKPSWRKLAEAARGLDNAVFEKIVKTLD